jgi:hypothetical protein
LPSSCRCRRSATPRGLALFRHCSASRIFIRQPGCSPPSAVTQDDEHRPCGGEKQAGLRPLPRPQLQGCSSSSLWRRASRAGVVPPAWAGKLLLPSAFRGEGAHRPCGGGELRQRWTGRPQASSAAACLACWLSWLWRGLRHCLLPLGPGVAVRPPHGRLSRRAHRGTDQDVVRHMGGVPVLGLSCPHSGTTPPRGGRRRPVWEDVSGDLPVQAGAAAIRRCGAGAQVDVVVGAEVVATRGGCLRR